MSGDQKRDQIEADLAGLSEEDRAFVLESRRRYEARKNQPLMPEDLQRRVESELGVKHGDQPDPRQLDGPAAQ